MICTTQRVLCSIVLEYLVLIPDGLVFGLLDLENHILK